MKKLIHLIALLLVLPCVSSCGEAEDKEKGDAINELSEEMKNLQEASESWTNRSDGKYFTIDVPNYMTERKDLNEKASLQYGYVERKQFEQFENFMLVMVETYEEIDSYDLEVKFTAMSYRDQVMGNFGKTLDYFEVLTTEPVVEEINGMNCIINEMRGSLGGSGIYYKLAVFEGKNGFYQVLCWCIETQKQKFSPDMDRMIASFSEK
jgi:hypothetical protein